MSARYERVNARDEDDADAFSPNLVIPNSPPPSFHSRASSRSPSGEPRPQTNVAGRGRTVDPALADAFDSDGESDDDDADDRQRLMRSRDALRPMRAPPSEAASNSAPSAEQTASTTNSAEVTSQTSQPRPQPPPPTTGYPGRVFGGGIQSDGVFSNLTARPEPGEEKDELPPTYEQAAADAAPPYWETTILGPGLGGSDEVYVDGMPVGSVFSFVWNGMISMSFQVVGFLLTYLLHSTHAAKNGSRAGLGVTMIQYGFYLRGGDDADSGGMSAAGSAAAGNSGEGFAAPPDPNAHNFDPGSVGSSNDGGSSLSDLANSDWVAYAVMIMGWFILIKAVGDYYKARKHEQLVLQSPDRGLGVAVIASDESPEHVV